MGWLVLAALEVGGLMRLAGPPRHDRFLKVLVIVLLAISSVDDGSPGVLVHGGRIGGRHGPSTAGGRTAGCLDFGLLPNDWEQAVLNKI